MVKCIRRKESNIRVTENKKQGENSQRQPERKGKLPTMKIAADYQK